jgi:hypothetical protein
VTPARTPSAAGAARAVLIWGALAAVTAGAMVSAAASPLLEWRQPVYVAAGFAGVVALALMLAQPLLAAGWLPGLEGRAGRRVHRWTGAALVASIVVHVAGLWVFSPPDVVDALLFASPTPFSDWGVVAMWAAFAAALLAALRRPARMAPRRWRPAHASMAAAAVVCGVVHTLLVEGALGAAAKTALCVFALVALAAALARLRPWSGLIRR